ncbi:hypothetical protein [Amycolatopsis granulosa]|uniref:hypothetical protein n=1 Tax=Amycolatopsis granulosa TaxID=185684 RepID=UPI00142154C3|nr:hypothetical protein [Amycolatopsis granulosa]NIH86616.1 hypothetical protein [Amycolatopsis granulosa]
MESPEPITPRVKSWAGARPVRMAMATLAAAGVVLAAAPTATAGEPHFYRSCAQADFSCQNGAKISGPTDYDRCDTGWTTKVCVKYDGDVVYVQDGSADGRSALGVIEASSGVRARVCRNPHGHGTWARCKFDWSEGAAKKVEGGVLLSFDEMHLGTLWSFTQN